MLRKLGLNEKSLGRIAKSVKAQMSDEEQGQDYAQQAQGILSSGVTINIDMSMPTIEVSGPNGEEIYYASEWQADEMLAEVPEHIDPEDYILVTLESSGLMHDQGYPDFDTTND